MDTHGLLVMWNYWCMHNIILTIKQINPCVPNAPITHELPLISNSYGLLNNIATFSEMFASKCVCQNMIQ